MSSKPCASTGAHNVRHRYRSTLNTTPRERGGDDPDDALLGVQQAEQHRGAQHRDDDLQTPGSEHLGEPGEQVAAERGLLAERGEHPGRRQVRREQPEVALQVGEGADVLPGPAEVVGDRDQHRGVEQRPRDGELPPSARRASTGEPVGGTPRSWARGAAPAVTPRPFRPARGRGSTSPRAPRAAAAATSTAATGATRRCPSGAPVGPRGGAGASSRATRAAVCWWPSSVTASIACCCQPGEGRFRRGFEW